MPPFMLPMLFALMAFPPPLVVLLRLDPLLRTNKLVVNLLLHKNQPLLLACGKHDLGIALESQKLDLDL